MTNMAMSFDAGRYKMIDANGHFISYDSFGAGARFETILAETPGMTAWIDGFEAGDIFWDIGANIGPHSVYAAVQGVRTYAFEPHLADYAELRSIIALNKLEDMATPLCVTFADRKAIAAREGTIGYDIDSFIADFGLDIPTHLKIDIGGAALAIAQGAQKTLADAKLKTVSITLAKADQPHASAVATILQQAGLTALPQASAASAGGQTVLFSRQTAQAASPAGPGANDDAAESDGYTIEDLIARIVSRIETAPADNASPSLLMEEMLPDGIYQELIARLPGNHVLDPLGDTNADGRVTRYRLALTEDALGRFIADDRPFWGAMIDLFTAPEITRALLDRFAPALSARFGGALPELTVALELHRDLPGARIDEKDSSAVAAMHVQLAAPASGGALGAALRRSTANSSTDIKPNSAQAFIRSGQNAQSIELGSNEPARNSLALAFFAAGQEAIDMPERPEPLFTAFYDAELSQAVKALTGTFTRRDDVATLFLKGGVGVELGVAAGEFSERILTRSEVSYLYSIDMWAGDRNHDVVQYREALARLAPHRTRNATLRMRFDEALPLFADSSLDFIYVDGYAHDGELNGQTFRDWYPKLKQGGIIAGDDYHPDWPLVVAAVDRFVAENRLELHVINCSEDSWNSKYPTWFALKP